MCASIIEYNKLITQNRENWQKAFHILDLISAVRLQRTIVSSMAFLFKGSKRFDLLWAMAMLRSVRLGKLSWIFTNVWRWHVVLGFVLSGTSWERWFLVSDGMNQSYLALVWILNLFWCLIPSGKLTWQWKMDQLKMYSLLKMVIFHCHFSLLEGTPTRFYRWMISQTESLQRVFPRFTDSHHSKGGKSYLYV